MQDGRSALGQVLLAIVAVGFLPISLLGASETCAEMASKDKGATFLRRAPLVRAATQKIVRSVPFSKRETNIVSMDQIWDLSIKAYNFGFVSSLTPKENLKLKYLKSVEKVLKDVMSDADPKSSEFANGWISKAIGVVSKSMDLGYADGIKPCPEH